LIFDTEDWSSRLVAVFLESDRFVLDPEIFDRIEQEAAKP
jgi:hypothetical protein